MASGAKGWVVMLVLREDSNGRGCSGHGGGRGILLPLVSGDSHRGLSGPSVGISLAEKESRGCAAREAALAKFLPISTACFGLGPRVLGFRIPLYALVKKT